MTAPPSFFGDIELRQASVGEIHPGDQGLVASGVAKRRQFAGRGHVDQSGVMRLISRIEPTLRLFRLPPLRVHLGILERAGLPQLVAQAWPALPPPPPPVQGRDRPSPARTPGTTSCPPCTRPAPPADCQADIPPRQTAPRSPAPKMSSPPPRSPSCSSHPGQTRNNRPARGAADAPPHQLPPSDARPRRRRERGAGPVDRGRRRRIIAQPVHRALGGHINLAVCVAVPATRAATRAV